MKTLGKLATSLSALALLASTAHASETITYTYDARGRLVKVVHTSPTTPSLTNNQACYTYDKADNRTQVKTTVASLPACP
jgi:YD repeat-containing protein